MKRSVRYLLPASALVAGAIMLTVATTAGSQQPGKLEAGNFSTDLSIAEVMESIVMPSAQAVWDAVAVNVTADGIIEDIPETDEEWETVRWSAVNLAEATNLLVIPGRPVAPPGTVSEFPEEELGPEQVQALLDKQWPAWVGHTRALHEIALQTIKVIDAHDVDGLTEIGGAIDEACENCHLQFWYPEQ
jgi:hypothetical protein